MSDSNTKSDLLAYVVRLGDDALVLGHRISEWTSNGPFLEEDIAMSNVALDFLGRARMFYTYAAEIKGGGATEDDFAYLRSEREFQNYLILELPKGDFAFTNCFHSFLMTVASAAIPWRTKRVSISSCSKSSCV